MKMTLTDGRVIEGTVDEMTEIISALERLALAAEVRVLIDRSERPRPRKSQSGEHPDFAEFWALYPRKVGRYAAAQAFTKVQAGPMRYEAMTFTMTMTTYIMNGLRKAVAYWEQNAVETKYIPHAATWLNQRRYEDAGDTDIQNQIVENAKRKLASGT